VHQEIASGPHIAATAGVMFKLEKISDGCNKIIRLVGRIQSEHLDELKTQLTGSGAQIVLDLDEVTLVDVDVVRFFNSCEKQGVCLLHCSPYIREWMIREQAVSAA
jgi:anti-anti-sigma regulatory factor